MVYLFSTWVISTLLDPWNMINEFLNSFFATHLMIHWLGDIYVGDGCWRRNMLVTTIRCLWRLWACWSPTSTLFSHTPRAPAFNDVTKIEILSPIFDLVINCESLTSQCHQYDLCHGKNDFQNLIHDLLHIIAFDS